MVITEYGMVGEVARDALCFLVHNYLKATWVVFLFGDMIMGLCIIVRWDNDGYGYGMELLFFGLHLFIS
jgi:hypothetical protein